MATVVSLDPDIDSDIPAMIGASAALALSGIPFKGPIGGARVGYIGGQYVLNPTGKQMAESQLDLVVAGTQDAVLMVESEAKELSEEIMLGAVTFGHRGFQPVIEAIIRLAERSSREPRDFTPPDELPARLDQDVAWATLCSVPQSKKFPFLLSCAWWFPVMLKSPTLVTLPMGNQAIVGAISPLIEELNVLERDMANRGWIREGVATPLRTQVMHTMKTCRIELSYLM